MSTNPFWRGSLLEFLPEIQIGSKNHCGNVSEGCRAVLKPRAHQNSPPLPEGPGVPQMSSCFRVALWFGSIKRRAAQLKGKARTSDCQASRRFPLEMPRFPFDPLRKSGVQIPTCNPTWEPDMGNMSPGPAQPNLNQTRRNTNHFAPSADPLNAFNFQVKWGHPTTKQTKHAKAT